jgi:hypothetical protein
LDKKHPHSLYRKVETPRLHVLRVISAKWRWWPDTHGLGIPVWQEIARKASELAAVAQTRIPCLLPKEEGIAEGAFLKNESPLEHIQKGCFLTMKPKILRRRGLEPLRELPR